MLPKGLFVKDLIPMFILNEENRHKIYYSTGINEMLNIKAGNLSLGQQRYLQFLLILNLNHPFILLDEPFSMVEPLYKTLIKEKIIAYSSNKGFLITDHYYLDVLEIASKIKLIKNGEIIPVAKSEDLKTLEYLSEQSILN
jgi:ABC-type lipopolysaccharide export system ATPase subunit